MKAVISFQPTSYEKLSLWTSSREGRCWSMQESWTESSGSARGGAGGSGSHLPGGGSGGQSHDSSGTGEGSTSTAGGMGPGSTLSPGGSGGASASGAGGWS